MLVYQSVLPQALRLLSHPSEERHCHQFYCQTTMSLDTYLVPEDRLRPRFVSAGFWLVGLLLAWRWGDSCQQFRVLGTCFPGVCVYYISQDVYIPYPNHVKFGWFFLVHKLMLLTSQSQCIIFQNNHTKKSVEDLQKTPRVRDSLAVAPSYYSPGPLPGRRE